MPELMAFGQVLSRSLGKTINSATASASCSNRSFWRNIPELVPIAIEAAKRRKLSVTMADRLGQYVVVPTEALVQDHKNTLGNTRFSRFRDIETDVDFGVIKSKYYTLTRRINQLKDELAEHDLSSLGVLVDQATVFPPRSHLQRCLFYGLNSCVCKLGQTVKMHKVQYARVSRPLIMAPAQYGLVGLHRWLTALLEPHVKKVEHLYSSSQAVIQSIRQLDPSMLCDCVFYHVDLDDFYNKGTFSLISSCVSGLFQDPFKLLVADIIRFLVSHQLVRSPYFKGLVFALNSGLAMGLTASTALANLTYAHTAELSEGGIIGGGSIEGLVHYARYVDNILCVCKTCSIPLINQRLSTHAGTYPFKVEGVGKVIKFLDCSYEILPDGVFQATPLLKPRRYISPASSHMAATHLMWPVNFARSLTQLATRRPAGYTAADAFFKIWGAQVPANLYDAVRTLYSTSTFTDASTTNIVERERGQFDNNARFTLVVAYHSTTHAALKRALRATMASNFARTMLRTSLKADVRMRLSFKLGVPFGRSLSIADIPPD